MIRFVTTAAVLAPLAFALCGSAVAQQAQPQPVVAPIARCGGVLCDLYYRDVPADAPVPASMTAFKTLPCHDFVCGMFGGRTPDQPVAEQAAGAPEPTADAMKPAKKRKHVAKARVAKVERVKADAMPAASAK